jgi:predicted metal-dependent phosphotriesterase family hydrolase
MIRTVLGDIEPAAFGVASCHDHLLIRGGLPVAREPDFLLDSVDRAVAEVEWFRRAGGTAVVDAMPPGLGRDPDGLAAVSRQSGVHVVAVTGFHKLVYYDSEHWLFRYDATRIADLLVAEIEEGMDRGGLRGPIVDRSPARAGAIKVATGYWRFGPVEEKLFDAAAQAQRRTGVPIITHTEDGTMAMEQARRLIGSGVAPDRIVIGHVDKNPDSYLHLELLDQGVNLEYDQPSRFKYGPDSRVVALLRTIVAAGHEGRVVFGMDFARRSYWRTYGGGPGMDYILARFVPRLRAEGLPESAIDALIRRNPARIFDCVPGAAA